MSSLAQVDAGSVVGELSMFDRLISKWQCPPGASLVGELRAVTAQIRALVGPDACPTVRTNVMRTGERPAISMRRRGVASEAQLSVLVAAR